LKKFKGRPIRSSGNSSKERLISSSWKQVSRETTSDAFELPTIVAYMPRERSRTFVRGAFPKRRWRVVIVRDTAEFKATAIRLEKI
jgi:hypothetical protein